VPLGLAELVHQPGSGGSAAGEGGDEIHGTELGFDPLAHPLGRLKAGRIGRDPHGAATRGLNRGDRVIDRLVAASDDADARAVLGQPDGCFQADTTGASGDDRDFALEVGITAHVLYLRFQFWVDDRANGLSGPSSGC
jgi:hypothetical protein